MKFNLQCPISDYIGYGIVGTNLAFNAFQRKIDIGLFPIHNWKQVSLRDQKYKETVQHYIDLGRNKTDHKLPCIKIWHQYDMYTRIGSGPLFGWPIFELNKFSAQEQLQLSITDEIIVCSKWAKDVVLDHLPNHKVHVVPLGVDRSIFHEVDYQPDKYIFLSSGKWEVRKNQDLIVEAFSRAFGPDDNVELLMSCHNIFYSDEEMNKIYGRYLKHPNVRIVGPFATQSQLARVMQSVSCGVFPSRAEGWNFELLEMMSCGKSVIASNYSAHTEFCTNDNCLLIEPQSLSDASDGRWFHGTGQWSDIGLDDLIEALRASYERGNIVNTSGIQTAQKFSWDNTLNECLNITSAHSV